MTHSTYSVLSGNSLDSNRIYYLDHICKTEKKFQTIQKLISDVKKFWMHNISVDILI